MSSFLLNNIKNGTIFRKKGVPLEKVNPTIKLAITTMYIISSTIVPLDKLVTLTIITIAATVTTARKIEIAYAMKMILIIATISALFVGLFYPWNRVLTVFLRITTIGLWATKFAVTTDPVELSRELEKRKINPKIALTLPLSLKLIPETAKDAEETLTALYFRGEIKNNPLNPKTYITPLTLLLAATLHKSKYIAEALASKAALKGRKTYYKTKTNTKKLNATYIAATTIALIATILAPTIKWLPF